MMKTNMGLLLVAALCMINAAPPRDIPIIRSAKIDEIPVIQPVATPLTVAKPGEKESGKTWTFINDTRGEIHVFTRGVKKVIPMDQNMEIPKKRKGKFQIYVPHLGQTLNMTSEDENIRVHEDEEGVLGIQTFETE